MKVRNKFMPTPISQIGLLSGTVSIETVWYQQIKKCESVGRLRIVSGDALKRFCMLGIDITDVPVNC
jgi:hypothetical protein